MSVSARDSTEYLAEFVAIGLGQIDSVSFGINVQQEDWNIVASEEGYDPIAATLAFATPGEPDFAGAICALDDVTGSGVSGEVSTTCSRSSSPIPAYLASARKSGVWMTLCISNSRGRDETDHVLFLS